MPFTSPLRKIDECENCGERLGIRQKKCPRCGAENPDYRTRNWAGGGIAGYEPENPAENEKENDY
jgi:RNA polymerase subunit RPABC4/transcription elongation factor Spt4